MVAKECTSICKTQFREQFRSRLFDDTDTTITYTRVLYIVIILFILLMLSIYYYYVKYTTTFKLERSWSRFWVYLQSFNPLQPIMNSNDTTESKGEFVARKTLENIFAPHEFPKVRLVELTNPVTNQPLELDGYNDKLKLAFEYDGEQHYNHVEFFHSTKAEFHNQKYRDIIKDKLCVDNGITLIRIPYTVSPKDIPAFISQKVASIAPPKNDTTLTTDE